MSVYLLLFNLLLIGSFFAYVFLNQKINFGSGISTIHAIFITVISLYFVFWSDLFSDQQFAGIVTYRSSPLSVFTMGVSFFFLINSLKIHSYSLYVTFQFLFIIDSGKILIFGGLKKQLLFLNNAWVFISVMMILKKLSSWLFNFYFLHMSCWWWCQELGFTSL